MRLTAALIVMLFGSIAYAEDSKTALADKDWYFGCREPAADELREGQPCWIQSASVETTYNNARHGKVYFQIHIFPNRKVLRVFIKESPRIEYLEPFVFDMRQRQGSFPEMKLFACTPRKCWGEIEISDYTLEELARDQSIGLLIKKREGGRLHAWVLPSLLNFSGFEEAVKELRLYAASFEDRK